MRKIRFRAKNAKGVWLEGSLIKDKYERSDGKQFDVAFIVDRNLLSQEIIKLYSVLFQKMKILSLIKGNLNH